MVKNEDDMPEDVWVNRNDTEKLLHGVTGYRTTTDKDISPSNTTHYRLKSTEDKTIRELAHQLKAARSALAMHSTGDLCKDYSGKASYACGQALSDNAPRIAEAQEKKQ